MDPHESNEHDAATVLPTHGSMTVERKSFVELTDDLTTIKIVLGDLISTLRNGRQSRCRSIIITQLQLVRGMVHEAFMEEE